MKNRPLFLWVFCMLVCHSALAQKQDYVWFICDSILLDFKYTPPRVDSGANLRAHESGSSICDESGNLIYYANHINIYNKDKLPVPGAYPSFFANLQMDESQTQGTLFLPWPRKDSLTYLFRIRTNPWNGSPVLMETILNHNLNAGSGGLTQTADSIIYSSSLIAEKLTAVRHANGNDWWLLLHASDTNTFIRYLIHEGGIDGPYYQSFGNYPYMATADPGQMVFDQTGSRLAFVNPNGIIDVYDFDHCSGLLTGWKSISWYQSLYPYFGYYGCAFSPGGRFLYVTQVFWTLGYASGQLWQFDLQAANPFNSRVNVYTIPEADSVGFGQLKLGPDGKIYVPYGPTMYDTTEYNSYNQFLGVINNPDQPGLACNFNLAQINVAPRKTNFNLPNLPNFRLGPIYYQPANAGPDVERCPDEPPVQLGVPDTSQGRCTFSWSPTAGLDDPSAAMPFADPDISTIYVLTVTDTSAHSACAVTYDTVQVNVKSCKLEIPNIVTPNGDGIADRFWIRNLEAGTHLFIFDRWGNELYQSPDYQNDYEPASLKEGVYYYRLEPPAGSLNKPSAGNFVLMR